LAAKHGTREFACAAIIDLVTRSAIRAGNETYTRLRGTRGAVTLLKSNVTVRGKVIMLRFLSKGGKTITRRFPPHSLPGQSGYCCGCPAAASSSIRPKAVRYAH
jgi:DNA topoisomerase-1